MSNLVPRKIPVEREEFSITSQNANQSYNKNADAQDTKTEESETKLPNKKELTITTYYFELRPEKKLNHHCQQQTATKFSSNQNFQKRFHLEIKHAQTKI